MLATISDRKIGIDVNSDGLADFYDAQTLSLHDYYPFGMQISARSFQSYEYKYGFNGMEKDDELKGEGNSYTTHFRQYDARLGRWLSRDPKAESFPWQSPYVSMDNNPILLVDPLGSSTHTDIYGRVLAVYDDNDLGVYMHDYYLDLNKDYQLPENQLPLQGANVWKMGETYTPFGFADFDAYLKGEIKPGKNACIQFNSKWADNEYQKMFNQGSISLYEYASKAGSKGVWDFKYQAYKQNFSYQYGSLLAGRYVSARDFGNMMAGVVGQRSYSPDFFVRYGFGLYNTAGNNKPKAVGLFLADHFGILGTFGFAAPFIYYERGENGEHPLSQAGIQAGFDADGGDLWSGGRLYYEYYDKNTRGHGGVIDRDRFMQSQSSYSIYYSDIYED